MARIADRKVVNIGARLECLFRFQTFRSDITSVVSGGGLKNVVLCAQLFYSCFLELSCRQCSIVGPLTL